jgi:hypothetical protein
VPELRARARGILLDLRLSRGGTQAAPATHECYPVARRSVGFNLGILRMVSVCGRFYTLHELIQCSTISACLRQILPAISNNSLS